MHIKKYLLVPALSLAVLSFCSIAALAQYNSPSSGSSANDTQTQAQPQSKMGGTHITHSEREFLKKAAEGGEAEVQLGQLAQQKASSSAVKQFGERMVNDHTKANDQLKQVAGEEHVTLPQSPSAAQKAEIQRLSKLSGTQFDDAYMKLMVKDHTKDVSEFREASKTASNPKIRQFASETLPTLESHLKEAKSIAPKETARK